MFLALLRSTTFALHNITRNLWMSVATIFLLTLTTLSITLVISLNLIGNAALQAIEQKVNVDFYFYPNVEEVKVVEAQDFLKNQSNVAEVIYTSQADALVKFTADHANDPDLLNSLKEFDSNILPASLTVRASDIGEYDSIIQLMNQSQYRALIKKTSYVDNQSIINTLNNIIHSAYRIGLVVSLIFILISVIVIFNTLRMTIYTHREEVGIMKLVGATNWFVRGPFILEGIVLGVIAAMLTLGAFYGVAWLANPTVLKFFAGYDFSLWQTVVQLWPQFIFGEIVGAALFSVFSSMVAITRYLKV